MVYQILKHTPLWVWLLLLLLIALGYSQTKDRQMGLWRSVLLPFIMIALAIYSTVSAFGLQWSVFGVWLFFALLVVGVMQFTPSAKASQTASYDPVSKQFSVAGSWWPMWVILTIFLTKYAVGVGMAMQPQLANDTTFASVLAAIYGVFSGYFAGRSLRLFRLL